MRYIFGEHYSVGKRAFFRGVIYFTATVLVLFLISILLFARTKESANESIVSVAAPTNTETATSSPAQLAFPIGVDPQNKEITEDPAVDTFIQSGLLSHITPKYSRVAWVQKIVAKLATFSWYQNMASPMSRLLVIESGERQEQVVDNFGDILRWDAAERKQFAAIIASTSPELSEGKYYPDNYVVSKDASPEEVAQLLIDKFNTEIVSRYTEDISAQVPLEDALIIASLLEREAYDFEDMRHISGVIWNRLFIDMNLQIDATLQYAKGSNPNQPWWPTVRPQDKYIKSPFNTYKNEGLPPAPIANPSLDAIVAALNPRKTDCMFYFHDSDGGFHCTPTYEEHVALLKQYYGRGK